MERERERKKKNGTVVGRMFLLVLKEKARCYIISNYKKFRPRK